jgi:hypothetical protein
MVSRECAEPYDIGILLYGRFDDILGHLIPDIDHFHARVAQGAGHHNTPPPMGVHPKTSYQNPNSFVHMNFFPATVLESQLPSSIVQAQRNPKYEYRNCPRFAWTPHPLGGSPVSKQIRISNVQMFKTSVALL